MFVFFLKMYVINSQGTVLLCIFHTVLVNWMACKLYVWLVRECWLTVYYRRRDLQRHALKCFFVFWVFLRQKETIPTLQDDTWLGKAMQLVSGRAGARAQVLLPAQRSFQQSWNAYCWTLHRCYKWPLISSSCPRSAFPHVTLAVLSPYHLNLTSHISPYSTSQPPASPPA